MARFTQSALRQIHALLDFYVARERWHAVQNLPKVVRAAGDMMDSGPPFGHEYPSIYFGHEYPSIYKEVARFRYRWFRIDDYWIGYSIATGQPVVTNIVYATANIPAVVRDEDESAEFNT